VTFLLMRLTGSQPTDRGVSAMPKGAA
jgi:hypothetical protein